MVITLVTRSATVGSGTAGYAFRLRRALEARGHEVYVRAPGAPTVGVTVGLERVPHLDVVRLGGGWHTDARRAIGRFPYTADAWRDRRTVRTARVTVVNSRMVRDALARRGFPSTVLRTGVDLQRFQPGEEQGALVFLAHGWRRKNFRMAMSAAAQIPNRPVWVGGRDGRRRGHLAWARSLLGARLEDLGPEVDAACVLPQASVVLHPTRYDPASNLVLEAMASGVPIVSTVHDGSAELLPSEFVVRNVDDVADLTRCCHAALEGGRALGTALRLVAEAWPDSRNAEGLEHVITRYVHGPHPQEV